MSADGTVQVAPDSTGKSIDTSELTVNSKVVERQRVVLGDPTDPAGLANIQASAPVGTEQGLVTRPILPAVLPISAAALPLPAGAALETGGHLDSIEAKTPALGPAAQAASVPVTLATDQPAVPVSIDSMPSTPVTGTFWQANQPVTGTFWQATQPVSAAALPLPSNAAQETGGNLAAILAKMPAQGRTTMAGSQPVTLASDQPAVAVTDANLPAPVTTVPDNTAQGVPVRPIGEDIWAYSACAVLAATIDPSYFTEMAKGTGVGVSQAGGNLLITAGTSTNAEYLARSTRSWRGSWLMRYKFTASQRVANNNFAVLLADLVADDAAYTINSATSVSVTKAAHGFDASNIGQFMCLGGISGAAGVPGRYAIASIPDANTINFTVAAWPASGSGTLHLFGWSYVRNLYTGATATQMAFDAQRKGWASGDTTATINTTAAPGHLAQVMNDGRNLFLGDSLVASSATPNTVSRASRVENIPDDNLDLYLFLWSYNGTSAPTATTWTVGFISVEKFPNTPVFLAGNRMQGTQAPIPVNLASPATVPVSIAAAITANGGTLATPTVISLSSAATTNATSSKASAGSLYAFCCSNTGAAAAFVKLYNKASAPTVGTDVPILTITVPAGGTVALEFGPLGFRFSTGIAFAITNLAADSDTTAVAAAQVKVIGSYV